MVESPQVEQQRMLEAPFEGRLGEGSGALQIARPHCVDHRVNRRGALAFRHDGA
jgi:hypothetical protein